jgi:chromosome segregation ATPase
MSEPRKCSMCGNPLEIGINNDFCMDSKCPFGRTEAHLPKSYETYADRLAAERDAIAANLVTACGNVQDLDKRCKELEADKSYLIDRIDLIYDELKRIRSCPNADNEIYELCDRAMADIRQWVPVIIQRDRAIDDLNLVKQYRDELLAELAAAKAENERLKKVIERLHTEAAEHNNALRISATYSAQTERGLDPREM